MADQEEADIRETAPNVERHLHTLRVGPEPDDYLYAMEALLEAWDAAFTPVLAVLQNQAEDTFLRCRAADALGASRDARAVHPLIKALRDDNVHVRASAVGALAQIGSHVALPELEWMASSDKGRYRIGHYTRIRLKVSAAEAVESIKTGKKPYNFWRD